MSIKSERAWEKLWKGKQLQAKIRQLEEDYNDYRILAQTKIRQLESDCEDYEVVANCDYFEEYIFKESAKIMLENRDHQLTRVWELEAENKRLLKALQKIVDKEGRVCSEYDICMHRACQSSYRAWAIAQKALEER